MCDERAGAGAGVTQPGAVVSPLEAGGEGGGVLHQAGQVDGAAHRHEHVRGPHYLGHGVCTHRLQSEPRETN